MTQAPVGVFKLMADGTTAQVVGKKYPTLEFDVTTVPGRTTTVGMPMYLKALDTENQLSVTASQGGTLRRCEEMRPQAGVGRLKPAPPMQANDLPVVAQAVSPAYRISSHLLTLPASPGFSLTVAPGSATLPGGSRSGCITVTPVNLDKIPMAPGFGQQPRFMVTIQPNGTTFNHKGF